MNPPPSLAGRAIRMLDAGLRPAEIAATVAGGGMMLAAMLLTSTDVVARYIFDAPLAFNYYLTENYLMVGLMTLPLAWGFRAGGYIRVVGLARVLPPVLRDLLLRAGLLSGGAYVAALGWLGGLKFADAWRTSAVDMGIIDWPVSLSWICIPVGLGLFALRLVLMALGPARQLHFDQDAPAADGA